MMPAKALYQRDEREWVSVDVIAADPTFAHRYVVVIHDGQRCLMPSQWLYADTPDNRQAIAQLDRLEVQIEDLRAEHQRVTLSLHRFVMPLEEEPPDEDPPTIP